MSAARHTKTTIVSDPGEHGAGNEGNQGKGFLVRIHPAWPHDGLIELPDGRYTIGRGGDHCQLELEDPAVSREHAYVERCQGRFTVADMGSTNGTFVNNERITQTPLNAGDLIRVGSHVLKFLSGDHVEVQYYEAVYSMMITDGLTGVHNHRYFSDALAREIARSQRHGRPLSLACLDIDHFKDVNDTYGHLAGDEVLRELCRRIDATIRADEVFARLGGEEFAVLLPETTLEQARQFADRVCQSVSKTPMSVKGGDVSISVSIGVAHTSGDDEITPTALCEEADRRLYQAKRLGRDRVCG